MRGKGSWSNFSCISFRITPAHAGKRTAGRSLLCVQWDHPRTCGEKLTTSAAIILALGSPPHMRGKAFLLNWFLDNSRITPAHAGKSYEFRACEVCYWDHPRTCGEKFMLCWPMAPLVGSPPHMRGKAAIPARRVPAARITPAHAGKSSGPLREPRGTGDHPRTCGEKIPVKIGSLTEMGSPPHMRGKDVRNQRRTSRYRITPAHAGKSLLFRSFRPLFLGSPPHMRGKEIQSRPNNPDNGITPAHAGKSATAQIFRYLHRDHPRTCGEKGNHK